MPDDLEPLLVELISGRSGSTLLMQLLGTSDAVAFDRAYPFENRYLCYLLHLLEPMGRPFEPERDLSQAVMMRRPEGQYGPLPFHAQMDLQALQHTSMRHAWSAFSEVARTERPDARYYAEKVFGDYTLLERAGIGTRMLQLVRDPRDVFSSIHAFDEKRGFFGFGRRADESEEDYLEAWMVRVQERYADLDEHWRSHPNVVRVRYEELVVDLPGVAGRLGEWLGVALDPAEVVAHQEDYRHHMTSADPAASIGQWRTRLPRKHRKRIERGLATVISGLGY